MSLNPHPDLPRASAGVAEPSRHDPDDRGHFGAYGGRYVAEALMAVIEEVTAAYDKVRNGNDHYAKRDACKNGHLFTPDNIYRRAKYPGTRYCKACAMDEQRRRRAKRAAYKKQWRDRRRAEGLPVT